MNWTPNKANELVGKKVEVKTDIYCENHPTSIRGVIKKGELLKVVEVYVQPGHIEHVTCEYKGQTVVIKLRKLNMASGEYFVSRDGSNKMIHSWIFVKKTRASVKGPIRLSDTVENVFDRFLNQGLKIVQNF